MAAKTTAYANELLNLIFNNVVGTALTVIGLRESLATNALYLSLHTASPGVGGSASTSECTYTGYARKLLARNSGAWTITTNSVSPTASVDFGKCTAGSETATYAGVSDASGHLLYFGLLSSPITIAAGTIPRIETTSTITET